MSRSFYYGTEAQLYQGSQAFTAKIDSDPQRYGLVEQQCMEYAAVALAYADAYFACSHPATRTRSKRFAKLEAKRALCDATAALVKIINGMAGVTDPERLNLGLSIVESPRPSQRPGTPDAFSIELSQLGMLTLKWTCANPQRGVMYIVSRSIGGSSGGAFEYLGVTGERRFVDATIPAGATAIVYRVQAVRLKKVGEPAQFNVNFGTNGRQLPTSMRSRLAA